MLLTSACTCRIPAPVWINYICISGLFFRHMHGIAIGSKGAIGNLVVSTWHPRKEAWLCPCFTTHVFFSPDVWGTAFGMKRSIPLFPRLCDLFHLYHSLTKPILAKSSNKPLQALQQALLPLLCLSSLGKVWVWNERRTCDTTRKHVFWRSEIITLSADRISRSCKWMSSGCPFLFLLPCPRSYKTCFTVRASKFEDWWMNVWQSDKAINTWDFQTQPIHLWLLLHVQGADKDDSGLLSFTEMSMVLREGNPDLTDKEVRLDDNGLRGRYNWILWSKNETLKHTFKLKLSLKSSTVFFWEKKTNFVAVGGPFSGDWHQWRSHRPGNSVKQIPSRRVPALVRSHHCQGGLQGICPVPIWIGLRKNSEFSEFSGRTKIRGLVFGSSFLGGSLVLCGVSTSFYSRKDDVEIMLLRGKINPNQFPERKQTRISW